MARRRHTWVVDVSKQEVNLEGLEVWYVDLILMRFLRCSTSAGLGHQFSYESEQHHTLQGSRTLNPLVMSLLKYSMRQRTNLCVFQVRSPQTTRKSECSPVSSNLLAELACLGASCEQTGRLVVLQIVNTQSLQGFLFSGSRHRGQMSPLSVWLRV